MIQTNPKLKSQLKERLLMLDKRDLELNLNPVPKEPLPNKPRRMRSTLLQLPRNQLYQVTTQTTLMTLMPNLQKLWLQLKEKQLFLLQRRRLLAVILMTVMTWKWSNPQKESQLPKKLTPAPLMKMSQMMNQRSQFPVKHQVTLKVKRQQLRRLPLMMMKKNLMDKKKTMERKKSLSRTCLSHTMKMESSPFSLNMVKSPTLNWSDNKTVNQEALAL